MAEEVFNGMSPGDPGFQDMLDLVHNMWSSRDDLLRRMADPHRDTYDACGYPEVGRITVNLYRDLFDRHPIAERAVQVLPKETWQQTPLVYERDGTKVATKFEKRWDALGQNLRGVDSCYEEEEGSPIWAYLQRLDVRSRIGTFGLALIGIDDGLTLEQPIEGCPPDGQASDMSGISQDPPARGTSGIPSMSLYGDPSPFLPKTHQLGTDAQYFRGYSMQAPQPAATGDERNLLFLRIYDESLVQITNYESSIYNRRFGQPTMYLITINDPRQSQGGIGLPIVQLRVHWSRVIHVCDNPETEIFGAPAMRPIFNNLLGLDKLYCGSPEMFWRGAFPGLSIETHPQLGGDVRIDEVKLKQTMDDYFSKLNRALTLKGLTAKSLAPQIADPNPQVQVQIEAICIQLGIPVRVFKGSERGELASNQDDSSWNDRLANRQRMHVTPHIIVPFVDRLIMMKVLPKPEHFKVEWPDMDSTTKLQRSQIALQTVQALAAWTAGNVQTVLPPTALYTEVLGWSEEKTEQVLAEAQEQQEQDQADAEALAAEHGFAPTPPEGFEAPAPEQPSGPPIKVKPGEKLVHPDSVKPPGGAKPPAGGAGGK